MKFRVSIVLLLLQIVLLTVFSNDAFGQLIGGPQKQLYYDRLVKDKKLKDYTSMKDVFKSNKFWLGQGIISGTVGLSVSRVVEDRRLKNRNATGFDKKINSSMTYSFSLAITREVIATVSFNDHLNRRSESLPFWIPDFSYTIGKYSYRPNSISYGYENYVNNRFSNDARDIWDKFLQGYYFASYSPPIPQKYIPKLDSTSRFSMAVFGRYAFKYKTADEQLKGGFLNGKSSFGIGARYVLFYRFYVEAATYLYPNSQLFKQPWDPDFSYGFGYFDWRPFRLSITYGNWAANRFPGREKAYPYYGFMDGTFSLSFSWNW